IILYNKKNEKEIIVSDAGTGPTMPSDSGTFPTVPVYWIDNQYFLYADYRKTGIQTDSLAFLPSGKPFVIKRIKIRKKTKRKLRLEKWSVMSCRNLYKNIEFLILLALLDAPVITVNYQESILLILKMINPQYNDNNYLSLYGNLKDKNNKIFNIFESRGDFKKILKVFKNNLKDKKGFLLNKTLIAFGFNYDNDSLFKAINEWLNPNAIYWYEIFDNTFLGRKFLPRFNSKDSFEDFSTIENSKLISLNKFAGMTSSNEGIKKLNNSIFYTSLNLMILSTVFSNMNEYNNSHSYLDNILVINNSIEEKFPYTITEIYLRYIKKSNLSYWKGFYSKYFPQLMIDYEGYMVWKESFLENHEHLNEKVINKSLININETFFADNTDVLKSILRTDSSWEKYGSKFWFNLFKNNKFSEDFYDNLISNDGDYKNKILRNIVLCLSQMSEKEIQYIQKNKSWIITKSSKLFNSLSIRPSFNSVDLLKVINNTSKYKYTVDEIINIKSKRDLSTRELRWALFASVIKESLKSVDIKEYTIINFEMIKAISTYFSDEKDFSEYVTKIVIYYVDGVSKLANRKTLQILDSLNLKNIIVDEYRDKFNMSTSEISTISSLFSELYKAGNKKELSNWFESFESNYKDSPVSTYLILEENLVSKKSVKIWDVMVNCIMTSSSERQKKESVVSYLERKISAQPALAFIYLFIGKDENSIFTNDDKKIVSSINKFFDKKSSNNSEQIISNLSPIFKNLSYKSIRSIAITFENMFKSELTIQYSEFLLIAFINLIERFVNSSIDFKDADAIIRNTINNRKSDSLISLSMRPTSSIISSAITHMVDNKNVSRKFISEYISRNLGLSFETFLITSLSNNYDSLRNLYDVAIKLENSEGIRKLVEVGKNINLNSFALTNSSDGEDSVLVYSWFDRITKLFKPVNFKSINIDEIGFSLEHIHNLELSPGRDNFNKLYQSLINNRFVFSDYVFINGSNPVSYEYLLYWLKNDSVSSYNNNFEVSSVFELKLFQTILLYRWVSYLYPNGVIKEEHSVKSLLEKLYFDKDSIYELFKYIDENIDINKYVQNNSFSSNGKKKVTKGFVTEGEIDTQLPKSNNEPVRETLPRTDYDEEYSINDNNSTLLDENNFNSASAIHSDNETFKNQEDHNNVDTNNIEDDSMSNLNSSNKDIQYNDESTINTNETNNSTLFDDNNLNSTNIDHSSDETFPNQQNYNNIDINNTNNTSMSKPTSGNEDDSYNDESTLNTQDSINLNNYNNNDESTINTNETNNSTLFDDNNLNSTNIDHSSDETFPNQQNYNNIDINNTNNTSMSKPTSGNEDDSYNDESTLNTQDSINLNNYNNNNEEVINNNDVINNSSSESEDLNELLRVPPTDTNFNEQNGDN
ncbi:MAG: hypothetical protein HRS57_00005, partial [Mycoplasmataceae bacterium]|nr:hypothetical protein [Mycoplasmataceae bacterium]